MVFERIGDIDSNYRAEISPWLMDYERYHKLLILADELAIRVQNDDITAIQPYYSILRQIYINFRPIMRLTSRKFFANLFDEVKKLFQEWKKEMNEQGKTTAIFPVTLVEKLIILHASLLETKQLIGLGIKVERAESEEEKIDRAMGIKD